MSIPSNHPKIVAGSVVLWLPRKFLQPDISKSPRPQQTEGHTYIQTASFPIRYAFKAKTPPFRLTTENWLTGAWTITDWLDAWAYMYDNWVRQGNPFTFYRSAAYSIPDGKHVFERCVWTGKDDGVDCLAGLERYVFNVEFKTEGASR